MQHYQRFGEEAGRCDVKMISLLIRTRVRRLVPSVMPWPTHCRRNPLRSVSIPNPCIFDSMATTSILRNLKIKAALIVEEGNHIGVIFRPRYGFRPPRPSGPLDLERGYAELRSITVLHMHPFLLGGTAHKYLSDLLINTSVYFPVFFSSR